MTPPRDLDGIKALINAAAAEHFREPTTQFATDLLAMLAANGVYLVPCPSPPPLAANFHRVFHSPYTEPAGRDPDALTEEGRGIPYWQLEIEYATAALSAAFVITDDDVEAAAQAIAPAAWSGQDTLAQANRRKASLRNARAALQSFIDRKLGRTKLASRAGTSGRGTA